MLAQALKVVDAARALLPTPVNLVPGLWRLGIEPRLMADAIRELGEAIESFDRNASVKNDAREMLGRAIRYAADNGIPAEEMIMAIGGGIAETEDEVRAIDNSMQLRPKPGEIGRPDPIQDGSPALAMDYDMDLAGRYQPPEPVFEVDPSRLPREKKNDRNRVPVNVASMAAGAVAVTMLPAYQQRWRALADRVGYEHDKAFAETSDFADAGIEFEAITERLMYAVGVHGWTPKLRALAAAWLHARAKMSLDIDAGLGIYPDDAALMLRCSQDLALIEANPDYAYQQGYDTGYVPPTPKPPGF